MKDPIRLLDEGTDLSPQERELLWSGRSMEPPPGAQDKIWAALNLPVGAAGGGGGGGDGGLTGAGSSGVGSSGTTIFGSLAGIKGVIAGIAGIATIAGAVGAYVVGSSEPPRKNPIVENPPRLEVPSASPVLPMKEVVQDQPLAASAEAEAPAVPSAAAPLPDTSPDKSALLAEPDTDDTDVPPEEPPTETKQERASRLREENAVLADARAALRGGDPASALAKLDAAGGRFPDGVLAQEREVLEIEALARAGKSAEASARANTFLQKYPTSPHAAKVRGFIQ